MGCGHRALGARLGPPGTPGTRVPRRVPGGRGIQGSRFARSTPRPIPQGQSRAPGKGPAGHAPSRRPPCARPVPTGTAILWPADPRAAGPAAVPTRPAAAPAGLACGPAGLGPGPAVKGQRSVPFPAPLPDPTPRVVGRVVGNVRPKTSGRRRPGSCRLKARRSRAHGIAVRAPGSPFWHQERARSRGPPAPKPPPPPAGVRARGRSARTPSPSNGHRLRATGCGRNPRRAPRPHHRVPAPGERYPASGMDRPFGAS